MVSDESSLTHVKPLHLDEEEKEKVVGRGRVFIVGGDVRVVDVVNSFFHHHTRGFYHVLKYISLHMYVFVQ